MPALLAALVLAAFFLFYVSDGEKGGAVSGGKPTQTPKPPFIPLNATLVFLEPGKPASLGNGFSIMLENASGCSPDAQGLLEIGVFGPSEKISTSQLWFGEFDVLLNKREPHFEVVAINGVTRLRQKGECSFREGLKEVKNVTLTVE